MSAAFTWPGTLTVVVALSCAISAAHPVFANDVKVIIPQLSAGELQSLRSRQQRLDFQNRQQINRELDSLAIGQRQPRLEVPVMKPRCPLQTSGTARTC